MARRGPGRRSHGNTEGRRLLKKYLKTHSQTGLAEKLGLGQSSISAWTRGTSRPEPHFRHAIERLTLIPFDAWYSDEERQIAYGSSRAA